MWVRSVRTGPPIAAALKRKKYMEPLSIDEIPVVRPPDIKNVALNAGRKY